jgi:N-acetylglucosamine-6-phosphate deacetylase
MASAVRNAVDLLGLSLAQAIAMASASPSAFLGLGAERGSIAPGQAADFVLLNDDLSVCATWINGLPFEQDALHETPLMNDQGRLAAQGH